MTALHTSPEAAKLATKDVAASPSFKTTSWLEAARGDYAIKSLSVLSMIGLWYVAASRLPPTIMPPPHIVVEVLWEEMISGPIWSSCPRHVAANRDRVLGGDVGLPDPRIRHGHAENRGTVL